MNEHTPVVILTGFLGSGKTTLLNQLLKDDHGLKLGVIINEFGEVGIDASLLEGDADFVEMDNGCLCCVLNDELVETIQKLNDQTGLDAIVLETTGVADPLPIAWPFLRQEFEGRFRFSGIVTVVDVLHFEEMKKQAEEVQLQIERADYIFLSKTDLVSQKQIEIVREQLEEINSNARFVTKTDPWIDLIFAEDAVVQELETQGHQYHSHKEEFQSSTVLLDGRKVSLEQLEDLFEVLPKEIFRAKAIFRDEAKGKNFVIHSVCGRIDFYELSGDVEKQALVFIGKSFDESVLDNLIKKHLN